MPPSPLRPGSICRLRRPGAAGPEQVLALEISGAEVAAVPYPYTTPSPELRVAADALEPLRVDEASARALNLQLRSRRAAAPRAIPARPIRTAMVLCAGLGTRLRPLTLQFPKPAVPFFSGPLVRYSFALLANAGVERVVINTHHLPAVMESAAAEEAARIGLELHLSHEPIIQGTAGGLRDAGRWTRGEPLLLLNGDAFMSFDLPSLIGHHQAHASGATLAVVPMPPGEKFGAVEADEGGEVRRIGTPSGAAGVRAWHFIGAHVIEPEVFDFIPASGEQDINRTVYPAMIAAGRAVRACPVSLGAWADMGTPRRYLQACEELLSGMCDLDALGRWAPLGRDHCARLRAAGLDGRRFVDPAARVAPDAALDCALVGAAAEVGAGARLVRAAVLPGTRIAPGELVEDAIASGELRLRAS